MKVSTNPSSNSRAINKWVRCKDRVIISNKIRRGRVSIGVIVSMELWEGASVFDLQDRCWVASVASSCRGADR